MTAPLSFKKYTRVAKSWDALAREVYIVWLKPQTGGRVIFAEGPTFDPAEEDYEQAITSAFQDLLQERAGLEPARYEAIVRIFMTEEEAGFYAETVGAFLGIEQAEVEVTKIKLLDLYSVLPILIEQAKTEHLSGLRFDVSTVRIEQFVPDTIDTVWSSSATPQ